LQWEEAETIESMSHGGHPHNQHNHLLSVTDSDASSNSSQRAASSLPSPPPSSLSVSKSPASRPALFGGDSDPALNLDHYTGTVPGLTGDDFLQHGLALPAFEANTAYQIALDALLDNHRKNQLLDAQLPTLALTSVPVPMSMTSPPATLSDSDLYRQRFSLGSRHHHSGHNSRRTHGGNSSSSSQRKLSTSELLGIVNIDDLLNSCGYTDTDHTSESTISSASTSTSPAMTDQSLYPSPIHPSLDLQNSPMDLTAASFEMMMAQIPVLLAEGDSKQLLLQQQQQQQQQRQYQQVDTSPTLTMASSITHSFAEIFHDLASPFLRMTSNGDPLIDGSSSPSTWSSLFPQAGEDDIIATSGVAKRVDMATQTDIPDEPQQQPSPASSTTLSLQGSPVLRRAHQGKQNEETMVVDPNTEWLSFLDEASPLFSNNSENEAVGGSSWPLHLNQASASTAADTSRLPTSTTTTTSPTTTIEDKGLLGWAGDYLQVSSLAPTGHRGIITSSSSLSGGPGGLIRSLHGGSSFQQRSGYHSKASAPWRPARATTQKVGSLPASTKAPASVVENVKAPSTFKEQQPADSIRGARPASSSADAKDRQETEDLGGLLSMFRGLWKSEK
ncbi:hypothetical protein BGZ98_009089, partial [Dissophora globulifera]